MSCHVFELHRDEDATGVSGTGVVAEGVIFSNGRCALTWKTAHTSVAVYDRIADVEAIHGHEGRTRVVWLDDPDAEDATAGPVSLVARPAVGWTMVLTWMLLGAGLGLLFSSLM